MLEVESSDTIDNLKAKIQDDQQHLSTPILAGNNSRIVVPLADYNHPVGGPVFRTLRQP